MSRRKNRRGGAQPGPSVGGVDARPAGAPEPSTAHEKDKPAELPVARTLGEASSIQLKLAIPVAAAIAAGAFALGGGIASLRSHGAQDDQVKSLQAEVDGFKKDAEKKNLIVRDQTDTIIRNLDMSDVEVHQWVDGFHDALTGFDLSISYNTRGFRIYQAEHEHALHADNNYRKAEIRRALDWFDAAHQANKSNAWSMWNVACMQALLNEADASIQALRDTFQLAAATDQTKFHDRVCTDTDLCVIAGEPTFQAYMTGVDCTNLVRRCPKPPITVR